MRLVAGIERAYNGYRTEIHPNKKLSTDKYEKYPQATSKYKMKFSHQKRLTSTSKKWHKTQMEVKKVKKTTGVVLGLALLMMFAAVGPVLANGPDEAFGVGNNPNLWMSAPPMAALHNQRGNAGGNIIWVTVVDKTTGASLYSTKWNFFDPSSGGGKMNNAIIATRDTLLQYSADVTAYMSGNPTVNENKWIFLSPEDSGNQYEGHGMVWNFFFGGMLMGGMDATDAAAAATAIANAYPNGGFWNYNFYK